VANIIEVNRVFKNPDNPENSLNLEPFKLYESIIVAKWPNSNNFNSAAMGTRIIDEYSCIINPYPETDTFTIIKQALAAKPPQRPQLTINFTDNMVFMAKAALTGLFMGDKVEEIAKEDLVIEGNIAYLRDANVSLLVEGILELKDPKIDASKYLKDFSESTVVKNFPAKFELNILKRWKSSSVAQCTNRGDNLSLEVITLTSKLPPLLKSTENCSKKEKDTVDAKIFKMIGQIREYQKEIRRFSADLNALTVCNLIDGFILKYF
jgi:hypothetical protein